MAAGLKQPARQTADRWPCHEAPLRQVMCEGKLPASLALAAKTLFFRANRGFKQAGTGRLKNRGSPHLERSERQTSLRKPLGEPGKPDLRPSIGFLSRHEHADATRPFCLLRA